MSSAIIAAVVVEPANLWDPQSRVKASRCAAQTALQKEGAIQRIHSGAHERENGKIEELCQGDGRRDRQIHNADRNFPQKR